MLCFVQVLAQNIAEIVVTKIIVAKVVIAEIVAIEVAQVIALEIGNSLQTILHSASITTCDLSDVSLIN